MSEPFLGEIKIMAWANAPQGWAMCNGQFLPINQNQALFSLLGTQYGGNGQTTFALPNLQGRAAVHKQDRVFAQGSTGGENAHTLSQNEMPQHIHVVNANNTNGIAGIAGISPDATKSIAQGLVSLQGGGTTSAQIFGTGAPSKVMNPGTIGNTGGSQAHENRQPYLALNFCIALQGIFPSQN